jgi:uncharacterized protein (TIGR02145 family)
MKSFSLLLSVFLIMISEALSQVSINTDGSNPDPSAILDAKSTTKGFLPPRMTTSEENAILSPVAGLVVFNLDTKTLDIYTGNEWIHLLPANFNWTPGQPFLDIRDNRTYKTVQIGNQCWFAENINVGTKLTGVTLMQNNGIIEKYCYMDNTSNCDVYGGLYWYDEAMQYSTDTLAHGICPEGWHIPTDYDWKVLEGNVDSQYGVGDPMWEFDSWRGYDAGGNLKESGTSHWQSPNTGATNASGFTGLPGGYRSGNGDFLTIGTCANFWTSKEIDDDEAWRRHLGYETPGVMRSTAWKTNGQSVRCLKNQ